jgi:hypothetical protein
MFSHFFTDRQNMNLMPVKLDAVKYAKAVRRTEAQFPSSSRLDEAQERLSIVGHRFGFVSIRQAERWVNFQPFTKLIAGRPNANHHTDTCATLH